MTTLNQPARGTWLSLLAGVLLGALLMLVGLAQAGRLAPSRPEVLVALAQTLEVEHQRVDLLLAQKDIAGAIAASWSGVRGSIFGWSRRRRSRRP